LDIGSSDHLRIVTTTNYNSPTEPHTPNIIVITADIESSVFSRRYLAREREREKWGVSERHFDAGREKEHQL
jgi:hypothetical protein